MRQIYGHLTHIRVTTTLHERSVLSTIELDGKTKVTTRCMLCVVCCVVCSVCVMCCVWVGMWVGGRRVGTGCHKNIYR